MIEHIYLDLSDQTKNISLVTLNSQTTEVRWWNSMIDLYGKDQTEDFIYAEAYKNIGNLQAAIDLLQPKATGTLEVMSENVFTDEFGDEYINKTYNDTRNWYQEWIDRHL